LSVKRCFEFQFKAMSASLISKAVALIQEFHDCEWLNSHWLSGELGVTPFELDSAFFTSRRLSCQEVITQCRVSRLFEQVREDPGISLDSQIRKCGFDSYGQAREDFFCFFGIELSRFRDVSCRALDDRQWRIDHQDNNELVLKAL